MTPDDWAAHNEWMRDYGKRLADGTAEDLEPLPPQKWWEGPEIKTEPKPYDGGYAGRPSDYRRPIVL